RIGGDCNSSTGGGVALYIKNEFDMKRIYLGDIDDLLEYICCVGRVNGLRLCVCVVYKPPNVAYSSFSPLFHALFIVVLPEVDEDKAKLQGEVDEAVSVLASDILKVFDACAPLVTKRVTKKKAPWRNCEIKRLSRIKNKLKKELVLGKNDFAKQAYCRARN